MSKKRRSRQTRRYTPPRSQPGPTTPAGPKPGQWRRLGSGSRRQPSMWPWVALAAVIVAGGTAVLVAGAGGSSSSNTVSSSGPLLAPVDSAATGQTVDGVRCDNGEQLAFHVHSHVFVFVNGHQRSIPGGIGITPPRQTVDGATGKVVVGGTCFYWLHSHSSDGVIHIESPSARTYTLGNYFDVWQQPLSSTQVGPSTGPVTAYVNGTRFSGNPRDIKIGSHVKIQLDVGKDVTPRSYSFPSGL